MFAYLCFVCVCFVSGACMCVLCVIVCYGVCMCDMCECVVCVGFVFFCMLVSCLYFCVYQMYVVVACMNVSIVVMF